MKKAYLATFLILLSFISYSQQAPAGISMQNFATVKVDELTDDQVNQFWTQAQSNGMNLTKIEQLALQRKMPQTEFNKLKSRIEKLASAGAVNVNVTQGERSYNIEKGNVVDAKDINAAFSNLKPKIFGSDLFNNKNLTFEPNLKMATPQDYQLGPDDEIVIDLYGYSDASYKLKVSPEGSIRIPNIGPVSVSGLTIEQASKRIIGQLASVYSGIGSGQSKVNISIGNIRSIKVTILGEVNTPGTYTLSSLSTVFNGLYASGGPSENGSFRKIQVVRNNKVIATIDIYEFLMNGATKGNILLQDQDIIKVSPYEIRVEMKGEVKRPGIYEAIKGETIKNMITYSGGFTDNAYRERLKVFRNTNKERSVADIPVESINTFNPQSGDVFTIDKLLVRFSNRVQINGAVFRPGFFALEEGMTLSKLILKADGLKEDAFTERGIIYRLKLDNSTEVLSFNLKDITSGKTDISLKREDIIQIASKLEMREAYTVSISGEVLKPGSYPFGENMKVEDLIIAAGGLKESSSTKVEISRRLKNSDPNSKTGDIATIIKYEINKENLISTSDIVLMPFDNISIFPSPGYSIQKNIRIEGEVLFPGQYSISKKNERLSEIISRAGGLTAQAFAEGAILIRTTTLSDIDEIIKKKKLEAITKQSSDTIKGNMLSEKESSESKSNIVGINLYKILKNSNSNSDLYLEDNDIIRIPKLLQTIQISGEVLYPVKVKYESGNGFKSYVNGAGGFSARSLKSRSYIVYANGTAASTKHFLFINFYPKVKPGSEIIVPVREERRKTSAIEIASIATSVSTLAFLLITLFKK
ncbi:MAG: SLBB domain-containing protein [Bacteroidota bacterium]